MRKLILSLSLCAIVFSFANAQQDSVLKDKKGRYILPQKGDFAIGISANGVLDYVGNMFSSSGNNNFNLNLLNSNMLFGKYFITDKSALRVKLGITNSTQTCENKVVDDKNSTKQVTDKLEYSNNSTNISVGYEKRRGEGRLQISYGAELNLGYSIREFKNTYGNKFSTTNLNPTSTMDIDNLNSVPASQRYTDRKTNDGVKVGLRVFTGVEYYVFPKISVGGEIGLGYTKSFNGKLETTTERWDYNSNSAKLDTQSAERSGSNLNSDILNGQIFILVHF